MNGDKKATRCASSPSPCEKEHVENQSMHSSFKGPPVDHGTNGYRHEIDQNHSVVFGYGYSRESNSGRGEEVGDRRGMEENLDISIHRRNDELTIPDPTREGLLLNQAAARGDSDSEGSATFLRLSDRGSPSSNDDFEQFERLNISPEFNSEVISLRNRLRESEEKRRELEEALALAQRRAYEAEASRRSALDDLSALTSENRRQDELITMKDLKLDAKRREIMRLRGYVQVYERDFNNLNERARAAEANAYRANSGWSTIRNYLYEKNLGFNASSRSEAQRERELYSLRRHADILTHNEAQNEAHNRNTQSYAGHRSQPRSLSPAAESSQNDFVILPPRHAYCQLEADSPDSGSNSNRAENVAQDDEETVVQDDEDTLVLESFSSSGHALLGNEANPGRSEHSNGVSLDRSLHGSGDSMSRSIFGNEVTCPSDDMDQLIEETEMRGETLSFERPFDRQ